MLSFLFRESMTGVLRASKQRSGMKRPRNEPYRYIHTHSFLTGIFHSSCHEEIWNICFPRASPVSSTIFLTLCHCAFLTLIFSSLSFSSLSIFFQPLPTSIFSGVFNIRLCSVLSYELEDISSAITFVWGIFSRLWLWTFDYRHEVWSTAFFFPIKT